MRVVLGLAILAMITTAGVSLESNSATCGQGVCFDYHPGDDGNEVEVGGITLPERPPADAPGEDPSSAPGTETGGGGDDIEPSPEPAPGPGDICWDNLTPLGCTTPTPDDPTPEEPTYPDTIYNTDLIRFTPHSPTATAPNEAMALAGTPLPITISAAAHSLTGTLLGHPVTVTFTPAALTLDHGDNTAPTRSTSNPATISHSYATRGIYPTTITAEYTATVTFPDNRPRPVQGTITATVSGPTTRILTAHTAPVHTTCGTAPAPGC